MPIDWKSAYEAAIREPDRTKLPDLCDQARRTINDRILMRGPQTATAHEREELEEALRQLTLHELRNHQPN